MEQHLTSQIQDIINQLEHSMFLSVEARHRLETELHGLVAQRDRIRKVMTVESMIGDRKPREYNPLPNKEPEDKYESKANFMFVWDD